MVERIDGLVQATPFLVLLPDVLPQFLLEVDGLLCDEDPVLLHRVYPEHDGVRTLFGAFHVESVTVDLLDRFGFRGVGVYLVPVLHSEGSVEVRYVGVRESGPVEFLVEDDRLVVDVERDQRRRVVREPEVLPVADEVCLFRDRVDLGEREDESLEFPVLPKSVNFPVLRVGLLEALDFLHEVFLEEGVVAVGRDDHVYVLLLDCAFLLEFGVDPHVLVVRIEVDEGLVFRSDEELEEVLSRQFVRLVAVEYVAPGSAGFLGVVDADELDDAFPVAVGLFRLVHFYLAPEVVLVEEHVEISLYGLREGRGELSHDRERTVLEDPVFVDPSGHEPQQKEPDERAGFRGGGPSSVDVEPVVAFVVFREYRPGLNFQVHALS